MANRAGFLALLFALGLDLPAFASSELSHREQSFVLHLKGSVAEVTPLFGPVREAEWAPGWAPRFVYPAISSQKEGAVFITQTPEGDERVWLLTRYDVKAGEVGYAIFTAGATINQITIHVSPDGSDTSRVIVTYRHSALSSRNNREVEKLNPPWAEHQRIHWGTAISAVLAGNATK